MVEHLHGIDDVQPDLLDQVVASHRAMGCQRADDLYGVGPNPGRSQLLKHIGQEPKSRRGTREVVNQDGRRRPAAGEFAQRRSADGLLQSLANASVADVRPAAHVVNLHFPVIGKLHFERGLAVPSGPRDKNFLHDFPPSPSPWPAGCAGSDPSCQRGRPGRCLVRSSTIRSVLFYRPRE